MLRMLLLTGLGARCTGLGFWAGGHPLVSLGIFAAFGLLLAWLQRFGSEAGKLGIGLCIRAVSRPRAVWYRQPAQSLCSGHAVHSRRIVGDATAFGLRGLHGLRMWPYMPRFLASSRCSGAMRSTLPRQQWRLHAPGLHAGVLRVRFDRQSGRVDKRGYWLTLADHQHAAVGVSGQLVRALQASLAFDAAGLLIFFGHSLQSPPIMVMTLLALVFSAAPCKGQSLRPVRAADQPASCSWPRACLGLAPGKVRLLNALIGISSTLTVALLGRMVCACI